MLNQRDDNGYSPTDYHFQTDNEASKKDYSYSRVPSDYSSGVYHHDKRSSDLIKKNEMLAQQLQIPGEF